MLIAIMALRHVSIWGLYRLLDFQVSLGRLKQVVYGEIRDSKIERRVAAALGVSREAVFGDPRREAS